jgi:hypothetical protein
MILYSSILDLIQGGVISHITPAVHMSLTTSTSWSDTAAKFAIHISNYCIIYVSDYNGFLQ